jgi:RNA polymerase sigma factor (sigma-70 family)
MDSHRSSTIALNGTGISLQDLVRGERAEALRAQLASWHPESSSEEIEDAIQTACRRFLEHAEGISSSGQVYSWIRITAHRILNRETARHARELAVDPAEDGVKGFTAGEPDPAEQLISSEDNADLARLAEEVSASLPERAQEVLALHGAGYKRPEIADRLGLSPRIVKRDVEEIMEKARAVLARVSGGGCAHGEQLILRFACGLATAVEETDARDHLARCRRCEVFCERLIAWREKAGAMLPAPVAEGASPGVLEGMAQKPADGFASVKQQILDGLTQLKQQAAATYYRAVDPTPLAAARPGTVATVVASCIALGGSATFCVEQGVNPLGAARGLIASAPKTEPLPSSEPPEATPAAPVYTPTEPASQPPTAETVPAEVETAPEPQPERSPPPVEDSYEPSRPAYMASESGGESSYETSEAEPVESPEPAPAPPSAGPQFGGP